MRDLLIACAAIALIIGCNDNTPDATEFIPAITAHAAEITMDSTPAPEVTPNENKTCPDCDGTGKVKTGDGISWTKCSTCGGDGKVAFIDMPTFQQAAYKPEDFTPYTFEEAVSIPTTLPYKEVNDCENGSCAVGCENGTCSVGNSDCSSCSGSFTTLSHRGRDYRLRSRVRNLFRGRIRGLLCR